MQIDIPLPRRRNAVARFAGLVNRPKVIKPKKGPGSFVRNKRVDISSVL